MQVHYGALDLLRLILMTIVFFITPSGGREGRPLIVDQKHRPMNRGALNALAFFSISWDKTVIVVIILELQKPSTRSRTTTYENIFFPRIK